MVIILSGVKLAENIISPFLIALFITAISSPAMFWLTKHKVSQGLAVTIIILSIILSGFILSSIISTSLTSFSENVPVYKERLQIITSSAATALEQIGIHIQLKELFNLGKVMNMASQTLNHILGALTNIFLILMMVIFLLLELNIFAYKFAILSNNPEDEMKHFREITDTINRYFKIKTLTSVITAIPIMIVLSIMGVDFPILWGTVAFFLNFIPNIGSIIAAIPAVLLALIQFGFVSAGQVILLYLIMNNLVGNFLEPKLMGSSLGISTLVVFLSLVFWGWLLGPIGMFLSVPITMTIKIIMDSREDTRWISILLSDKGEKP